MTRHDNAAAIGLIAIVVGAVLVMGGLMFLFVMLLVTSFVSEFPRIVLIPPLVQVILGLFGAIGGVLLRRGHSTMKLLLLLVGIGVVANLAFLVAISVAKLS